MENLQLKIALSIIPHIGPLLVKRLIAYTGSIEAVFSEKKSVLGKVPGIGKNRTSYINRDKLFDEAEKEILYLEKEGIGTMFYLDKNYPLRLSECEDCPIMIYCKGEVNFNSVRLISIVGTRNATRYGIESTEEIVSYLAAGYPELIVVSGLAYGIDAAAHKFALKNNLDTIAVLGHGLKYIYPSLHRRYAKEIEQQGALITEFPWEHKPDPGNFVSRNRIIAGLSDATLVVESAEKGGALITADIANSYNRDVFALPGKGNDVYSKGCNNLIKYNKAALIENGADIEKALGWNKEKERPGVIQKLLFPDLSEDEKSIMDFMDEAGEVPLDEISFSLNMPVARVSALLLNLEFSGLVRMLPGKFYKKL